MNARRERRGFTMVELGVIVIVVAVMMAFLLPLLQRRRAAARQEACLNNLKQVGLGFMDMESAVGRFPSSCGVTTDEAGHVTAMDGWSWCVHLLPYMENQSLYDTLDIESGIPLWPKSGGSSNGIDPHAAALATAIPKLHCPGFGGRQYVDRAETEAITNYKAMGATHIESLSVASPTPMVPRYNKTPGYHPDGALFPGSTHGVGAFSRDGTNKTILVVESVEQNVARWTVGNETCVVGLPPVVTFEDPRRFTYYHPTHYTAMAFWSRSKIPDHLNQTHLRWDYDAKPYDDGGVSTPSAFATGPIKYGPSSHHQDVTNHIFADGSVHAIDNDIDVALYMFMITRNNNDPVQESCNCPDCK